MLGILVAYGYEEIARTVSGVVMRRSSGGATTEIEITHAGRFHSPNLMDVIHRSGVPQAAFETAFDPAAYEAETAAHDEWLRSSSEVSARQYRRRLNDDPDSAVFESLCRILLVEDGVEVGLGEDPVAGGVDFTCRKDGSTFAVEVSSLRIETVEEYLSVPERPSGPFYYRSPSSEVRRILSNPRKRRQLSKVTVPLLLVIGTQHYPAASVVTDSLLIEWMFCEPPHQSSVFPAKMECGEDLVPREVSGILLFGAAARVDARSTGSEFMAKGVLNPNSIFEFRPELLPMRAFCRYQGADGEGSPTCRWEMHGREIQRPN